VRNRKINYSIHLDVIKDYILKLKSRGLKAVIITGGGEPTLYPQFNQLVDWLKYDEQLSLAIITNGTMSDKVKTWDAFSWVRISINEFKDWQKRIYIPAIKGALGFSLIYVGQTIDTFKKVGELADKLQAKYIRVLPNCLLEQQALILEHNKIDDILEQLDDNRFFHQMKLHDRPVSAVCHQAYFRPYLSEIEGGTVFPCDSLVLNDQVARFDKEYAICKPVDILDFLDGKIQMKFNAQQKCSGCVFTHNIKLLDDWKNRGINKFDQYQRMEHEEFV